MPLDLSRQNYFEDQNIIDLKNFNAVQKIEKKDSFKKRILPVALALLIIVGIWYVARANQALEAISVKGDSLLERVIRLLPLDSSFFLHLPIEKSIFEEPNTPDKRINYLILGMRGKDDPNGGLLADSSIIISIRPYDDKAALISIPRDLYVEMPGLNKSRKINEAYEIGETQNPGRGLEYTKSIFSDIIGMPVHFAAIVNFKAFKDIIDSLGGVEITLDKPFFEPVAFEEGTIDLPSGKQTIDGATALLYTRARMSSSDFDRSRRQQQVVKAIYSKFVKTGILLNPYRLNKLLNIMESNVRTDMKAGETEETIKLFSGLGSPDIKTKVIDNGPEKLLYSAYNDEGAFILLPTDGNYKKIQDDIKNIFN